MTTIHPLPGALAPGCFGRTPGTHRANRSWSRRPARPLRERIPARHDGHAHATAGSGAESACGVAPAATALSLDGLRIDIGGGVRDALDAGADRMAGV